MIFFSDRGFAIAEQDSFILDHKPRTGTYNGDVIPAGDYGSFCQ
jgi:hypothetical protein